MSGEIRPHLASDGVPMCTDSCPSYDGARCRVLGFKPGNICEPAVGHLVTRLSRLEERLEIRRKTYEGIVATYARMVDEAVAERKDATERFSSMELGLVDALAESHTERDSLATRLSGVERDLAKYRTAVAEQLHYDMCSVVGAQTKRERETDDLRARLATAMLVVEAARRQAECAADIDTIRETMAHDREPGAFAAAFDAWSAACGETEAAVIVTAWEQQGNGESE